MTDDKARIRAEINAAITASTMSQAEIERRMGWTPGRLWRDIKTRPTLGLFLRVARVIREDDPLDDVVMAMMRQKQGV